LRGYIVDDQDRLRTHMVIFVDGQPVKIAKVSVIPRDRRAKCTSCKRCPVRN
jgi:hypothetical protein